MQNLFILGAGASKQAGAPLMDDFLDCANDLLRLGDPGVLQAKDQFEDVFTAIGELRSVHSKSYLNLDNIEMLFGAIEMATILGRLGNRDKSSINSLRDSLITVIYKTLESSILFPVENRRIEIPRPYDELIEILLDAELNQAQKDPHKFSFITFNYDLCLDAALSLAHRQYCYCLDSSIESHEMPLLKLHGSINWGQLDNGSIIPNEIAKAQFNMDDDTKHVCFNLGSTLSSMPWKGGKITGPPVIVPPTWNKNSYRGQLSNVWSQAAQEFAKAENIFVIGYSLPETDTFFRYLFAIGSDSPVRIRNLIVINTDESGEVENRFRNLIGKGIESRFQYIPLTFEEGLRAIRAILINPYSVTSR